MKSNDISPASLPNISHVADVFIDVPTRVVREILKLRLEIIECVLVALPSSDADICVGKRDEVIETVASGICKEADMSVLPVAGIATKEAGRGSEYLAAEAPERDTAIRLETDDVGAT